MYMEKNGIEYSPKMADLEQRSTIVMLPLIKPSYDIIASNVYMSGPMFKQALGNFFEEIALILYENPLVEVDLGDFGKFIGAAT